MSENFQRLEELFARVRDLSPAERVKVLDEETAGSPQLKEEILRLLTHHDASLQPLETPAVLSVETKSWDGKTPHDPSRPEGLGGELGLEPGTEVDDYRILKVIDRGGMGVVYLAEQAEPKRQVALKVIRPELASGELLKRFRFEASVLARLQHPGIATIHGSGQAQVSSPFGSRTVPYIAMEYIDGPTIVEHCRELGTKETLEIFCRVCDAVEQAHRSGFIHRDLKPRNVLVQGGGHPKILDFGIARAMEPDLNVTTLQTQVGQLVGSIPYMSPEQVTGNPDDVDHRSDVYALGVVLFELLAGRTPIDLKNKSIIEASRMITEVDPLELSAVHTRFRGDLSTIVNKALEKRASERYGSAAALAADLRRHLSDEPIQALAPTRAYKFRKFCRRNRGLVTGLAIGALILVIGTAVSTALAIRNGRLAEQSHQSEIFAKRTLYRTSISGSQVSLEARNFLVIRESLDVAPPEYRNWEWRFLDAVVRGRSHVYPSEGVTPAIFTPDNVPLAPLQREGRIEVTQLDRGVTQAVIETSRRYTECRLSGDGRRLFAYDRAGEILDCWDLESGEFLWRADAPEGTEHADWRLSVRSNDDGGVVTVDFGPILDGRTGEILGKLDALAAEIRGTQILEWEPRGIWNPDDVPWVRWADAKSGARSPKYKMTKTQRANGIAWEAGGGRVAIRDKFGLIEVLDEDLEFVEVLGAMRQDYHVSMHFEGNEVWEGLDNQGVELWDLRTGDRKAVFLAEVPPTELIPSPRGNAVVVTGEGGVEYREFTATSEVLEGHESFVYSLAFSPDGTMLVSGAWDGTVRVWDLETHREVAIVSAAEEPRVGMYDNARGVSFSSDGARVIYVANTLREVVEWDLASGVASPIWTADEEPEDRAKIASPFFQRAPGGARIYMAGIGERYSSSDDKRRWARTDYHTGKIELYQRAESDGEPDALLAEMPEHEGGGRAVAFDPTGTILATSGGENPEIQLWNLEDKRAPKLIAELEGSKGPVFSLDFHPDGTRLVAGGRDGVLRLWDLETNELILSLRGHQNYIHSVAFSPDGSRIASASGDHTIRVWDSAFRSDRVAESARSSALQTEVAPLVEQLIEKHGERAHEEIEARFARSPEKRRAALRVQMQKRREKAAAGNR